MKHRSRMALFLISGFLFGLGLGTASGHPVNSYYAEWWQRDLTVNWGFTEGFPNNAFRDRVREAATEWNDENQTMTFHRRTTDYADFDETACPNSYQKNGIHWHTIDGADGFWAKTFGCVFSSDPSELYSKSVRFDSAEAWYLGTDDPGAWQYDALGAATHEFGHVTGFFGPYAIGHFDPDAPICTTVPKHTMCPYMASGEKFMRLLAEHDQEVFGARY
jgi:matrixin